MSGASFARRLGGQWNQIYPTSTSAPPPAVVPPTAAFTDTVTNLTVAFDASSSTAGSTAINAYAWDFGDSSTGTGTTPSHTYGTAGVFQVTLTVTDTDGSSSQVTHAVTTTQPAGTEPSGPGIVGYETLTGSTFSARVNSASTSNKVALPAGTYTFSDFADDNYNSTTGFGAELKVAGLLGSGIGQSIIEMVANTSTKTAPTSGTNGYTLVRFTQAGVTLDGFTLQGTTQQNLYNGIRVGGANPTLSNLKIIAIPGNDKQPPGETFGINLFSGSGGTTTNVEIDGGGVGASAFATNTWSNGHTWKDCYAHDNPYSAGAALWQHSGGASLIRFKSHNNRVGLNLERTTGTITCTDPDFAGNSVYDVFFGNDQSSDCQLVLAYTTAPAANVTVHIGATEQGAPNLITRSNVKLTVGGVDKTSTYVTWA